MSLPRAVQRRPALFRLREKNSSLRSNAFTVTNPMQIAKTKRYEGNKHERADV